MNGADGVGSKSRNCRSRLRIPVRSLSSLTRIYDVPDPLKAAETPKLDIECHLPLFECSPRQDQIRKRRWFDQGRCYSIFVSFPTLQKKQNSGFGKRSYGWTEEIPKNQKSGRHIITSVASWTCERCCLYRPRACKTSNATKIRSWTTPWTVVKSAGFSCWIWKRSWSQHLGNWTCNGNVHQMWNLHVSFREMDLRLLTGNVKLTGDFPWQWIFIDGGHSRFL